MGHGDHNRSFFSLVYRDYCDSKSLKNYIILKKLACVDHFSGGGEQPRTGENFVALTALFFQEAADLARSR